ncbi:MAG: hypothetical protein HW410_30 [Nitrosarchaeum sp.]|nr:hypothetical protein [Nitrosarchaeum sp.]
MDLKNKLAGLVFALILGINLVSSGGHFDSNDGIEQFLITESIVLKNTFKLDPTVPSAKVMDFNVKKSIETYYSLQNGKQRDSSEPIQPIHSMRSLLLSIIAIPFYYLGIIFSISPITTVGLFVNSIVISLTALVIFYFITDLLKSTKIAVFLAVIFSVSTFIWPYNTSLFPQPLQGLTLISSIYFLNKTTNHDYKSAVIGGTLLGLTMFTSPASMLFVAGVTVFSIFKLPDRKIFATFLVTLILILFILFILNFVRFGSFTDFGYGTFSNIEKHSGVIGLAGLIFSPGFGILAFFPLAILTPFAIKRMYKSEKLLAILFIYIILSTWLFYGTITWAEPAGWSGAGGWGPRYLVGIIPIFIVSMAFLMKNQESKIIKGAIIITTVLGFVVNLLGVLVWYMYGYSFGWVVERLWQKENSMNEMTWVPQYSPIILHLKALMINYVGSMQAIEESGKTTVNGASGFMINGLYSCSIDSYIFCKVGFVGTIIALIILAILVIIILKINKNNNYKGIKNFN